MTWAMGTARQPVGKGEGGIVGLGHLHAACSVTNSLDNGKIGLMHDPETSRDKA